VLLEKFNRYADCNRYQPSERYFPGYVPPHTLTTCRTQPVARRNILHPTSHLLDQ
jgi:hypothetical protein